MLRHISHALRQRPGFVGQSSQQRQPKSHPTLGTPSAIHIYTDEIGSPIVAAYRFDNSDDSDKKRAKEYRPFNYLTGKWKAPELRPIYNLEELSKSVGPVVIVEGEKCADALKAIGVLATTTFGGCNGVGKADLLPLKGRDVIIWPDNDEPGRKYANALAIALAEIGAASVKLVVLDSTVFPIAGGR